VIPANSQPLVIPRTMYATELIIGAAITIPIIARGLSIA